MPFRIAVVGTYPHGTFEKFKARLGGAELLEVRTQREFDALEDAEAVLLRILKMPAADIRRLPSLKAVLRWGAGFDTVDLKAAGERGVYVCNTPGANAGAVAELAVMMMLALGRKVLCYRAGVDGGQWPKNAYRDQTATLQAKTVGIIGGGNIGRKVAQAVRSFGAAVQYYDPFPMSRQREAQLQMKRVPLEKLLATSDIVTLHVPLLDSTRGMIGPKEIASMKEGAILINCARGGLMDDAAVLRAVACGKLAGAGIDTPDAEPPPADSGLRGNPNILLTPHIGGDTADVADAAIPIISDNLKKLMRGEAPAHVVNAQFLRPSQQP